VSRDLAVRETSIPGLFEVDLQVHGDPRGWFKESYQRVKLEDLGLPRLDIKQNNVSYNEQVGVTRGIHAEPWEKYISPAFGRVFNAIVDLRAGDGFGRVETFTLTPEKAIFVPRGCGNAFCTLEPNTVYNYLVSDVWTPGLTYPAVELFDADLAIDWPLPPGEMVISDKDRANPPLSDVTPIAPTSEEV
jgi:dTDP-4-dehydrorhamnose 3,5-epimerase